MDAVPRAGRSLCDAPRPPRVGDAELDAKILLLAGGGLLSVDPRPLATFPSDP